MLAELLEKLNEQQRKRLLEVLEERYSDELRDAELAERAAAGLRYEELRSLLRKIAARERRHAELLKQKIRALGGTPPPPPELPAEATWRQLLEAFESEKADQVRYIEDAYGVGDPEVRALFERIHEEEEENYRDLLRVITKLDPYQAGA
ncbi:ferritin-like domain-containing protein [Oceanithermus sp.]